MQLPQQQQQQRQSWWMLQRVLCERLRLRMPPWQVPENLQLDISNCN
jgi:hypothetical protein